MRRRGFLAGAVACVPFGRRAAAHPMPNSTVCVDVQPGTVRLVVSIPMSELSAALAPAQDAAAVPRQLLSYLGEHATIVGTDGRPWSMELKDGASARGRNGAHPVFIVDLIFRPPVGGAPTAATLRYDAVNHRVASHYVLVYRCVGAEFVPLGRLQSPTMELKLP